MQYIVRVFEVSRVLKQGEVNPGPRFAAQFTLEGDNLDLVKEEARARLTDISGYGYTLRSLNFSADGANQLVAYVCKKE